MEFDSNFDDKECIKKIKNRENQRILRCKAKSEIEGLEEEVVELK